MNTNNIPGRVAFLLDNSKLPPRAGHVSVMFDNVVLIWGGYQLDSEDPQFRRTYDYMNANEVYAYHTETDKWFIFKTATGLVPSQCSGACAIRVGSCLYLFGGFFGNMDRLTSWRKSFSLHILNLETMAWSNNIDNMEEIALELLQQESDSDSDDIDDDDDNDDQAWDDNEDGNNGGNENNGNRNDNNNNGIAGRLARYLAGGGGDNAGARELRRRRRQNPPPELNPDLPGPADPDNPDLILVVDPPNEGPNMIHNNVIHAKRNPQACRQRVREERLKRQQKIKDWVKIVPTPRHKFVGWEFDGKLHYFGGFGTPPDFMDQELVSDLHYKFLNDNGTFTLDESITYPSGWNNQLIIYDLATKTWSNPKPHGQVPCPRAAHAACKISPTKIILFGGRHKQHRLSDLYIYDCDSMNFTCISSSLIDPEPYIQRSLVCGPKPPARSWTSMCRVSPSHILLYGGFTPDQKALDDCWVFNTESFSWTRYNFTSPTKPRLWHTCVSPGQGAAYMFGGCENNIYDDSIDKSFSRELLIIRTAPKSLVSVCLEHISKTSDLPTSLLEETLPRSLFSRILIARNPVKAIDRFGIYTVAKLVSTDLRI